MNRDFIQVEGFPLSERDDAIQPRLLAEGLNRALSATASSTIGTVQPQQDVTINSTSWTLIPLVDSTKRPWSRLTTPIDSLLLLEAEIDFEVSTDQQKLTLEILVDGVAARTFNWLPQATLLFEPVATGFYTQRISAPARRLRARASAEVKLRGKVAATATFTIKTTSLLHYHLVPESV